MTKRADLSTRLSYALAWVRGQADLAPAAGSILGSGLGGFADRLESAAVIPYEEIPDFPVSSVPGHRRPARRRRPAGRRGPVVPVVAMQGRVHGYEGWSAGGRRLRRARAVRARGPLLLVTNAAGGVNPSFAPGDLVRIADHLNLSGHNPLVGENDDRLGPRFPDLTQAYDPAPRRAASSRSPPSSAIPLRSGVYACLPRPVLRDARRRSGCCARSAPTWSGCPPSPR